MLSDILSNKQNKLKKTFAIAINGILLAKLSYTCLKTFGFITESKLLLDDAQSNRPKPYPIITPEKGSKAELLILYSTNK
jgi:hypothetical protein